MISAKLNALSVARREVGSFDELRINSTRGRDKNEIG
jgi:hypothetical protein